MATNSQRKDFKGQRVSAKGLEESEEVGVALRVRLLLFLELTLQGEEIIPELLI